jgi:hypothetical protein
MKRSVRVAAIAAMATMMVSITAAGEMVRNILPPLYISDPEICYPGDAQPSCFSYDFNARNDRFYLSPRYQRVNWDHPEDGQVTAIEHYSAYDARLNTGLQVDEQYQRGPIGGPAAQSTFQLKGYQGGMLMRSWDSPHPQHGSGYPDCPAGDATGANKHTVYQYTWAIPQPVFRMTDNPVDTKDGLVVQADVTVNQFEAWSTLTGLSPQAPVIGQYFFVVYLRDPAGKSLQYVVILYSSPCAIAAGTCSTTFATYDGSEGVGYEAIGGSLAPYIVTSFRKDRPMTFSTIRPDSSGEFSNAIWPAATPFFRVYITPFNLQNAIYALNTFHDAGLSQDVLNYTIAAVAINQEVIYADNGDAFVMGSSFGAFGVFEITP